MTKIKVSFGSSMLLNNKHTPTQTPFWYRSIGSDAVSNYKNWNLNSNPAFRHYFLLLSYFWLKMLMSISENINIVFWVGFVIAWAWTLIRLYKDIDPQRNHFLKNEFSSYTATYLLTIFYSLLSILSFFMHQITRKTKMLILLSAELLTFSCPFQIFGDDNFLLSC